VYKLQAAADVLEKRQINAFVEDEVECPLVGVWLRSIAATIDAGQEQEL
jgi:hypothetical protein